MQRDGVPSLLFTPNLAVFRSIFIWFVVLGGGGGWDNNRDNSCIEQGKTQNNRNLLSYLPVPSMMVSVNTMDILKGCSMRFLMPGFLHESIVPRPLCNTPK